MFGSKEFLEIARRTVFEMAQEGLDSTDNVDLKIDNVYVTWFGFILGDMKALVSTSLPDGKYYEVTYNKEKKEIYTYCYVKLKQKLVTVNM
jgi:hypothetical protein